MYFVDCQSYESALDSISNMINIDSFILENELKTIDFEKHYEDYMESLDNQFVSDEEYIDFGDYILKHLCTKYRLHCEPPEYICWFHLSRSIDPKNFKNGIYPLGLIIDKLFDDMYPLVKDTIPKNEWEEIRRKGLNKNHYTELYKMKISDPFHHGPYAMLVKEIAFHKTANHDYLHIPEIIEDISHNIDKHYGIAFNERFIKNSCSTIVKFSSPLDRKIENIASPILVYLYSKFRNEELDIHANTCFDAKAQIIRPDQILGIEIV